MLPAEAPPTHWWQAAARGLLDLVFPAHCIACDEALAEDDVFGLCLTCRARLPLFSPDYCRRCGAVLGPHIGPRDDCAICPRIARFRGATAVARYDDLWRRLVRRWKFSPTHERTVPLADLLAAQVRRRGLEVGADAVVAVPRHWMTALWYGSSPTDLLARGVARRLGLPFLARAVRKRRRTGFQRGRSRAERQANMADAFAPRRPRRLAGRTLLLVDDLLTTGATANAMCATLRGAGAREVRVAVLARTHLSTGV